MGVIVEFLFSRMFHTFGCHWTDFGSVGELVAIRETWVSIWIQIAVMFVES
jgi:hypothetical protein